MRRIVLIGLGSVLLGFLAAVYMGEDPTSFPVKKLTRVDVLPNNASAGSEEDLLIMENDLADYREVLEAIEWQPGASSAIADADIKAVLFYELDRNMPERLVEHNIYFAEDGTAEIASNLETERYAVLDAATAGALQKLLDQQN